MTVDAPVRKPNFIARLAHPGEFLRWTKPLARAAGDPHRAALRRRALLRALQFARGLPDGRHRAHHVRPRAQRLAQPVRLRRDVRRRARHPGLAPPARRRRAKGRRPARRDLHRARALHRLALGPPDLGHVLGVGRADDLDAHPALHLSRHHRALARLRRPAARRPIVAIVTLVGAVNIPIIKFSVDWWNTLHQPASVFTAPGPTMPGSILTPLS